MDARRVAFLFAAAAGAMAPAGTPAAEPPPAGGPHAELYRKVAPAVVAIESHGSGVLISPDGLILTSDIAVPPRDRVMVLLQEGERLQGKVVGRDPARDLALVRVERAGARWPCVAMADAEPPLGAVVYTLGNVFQSLSGDGQVAISVGVVSGRYDLTAPPRRGRTVYAGPVIEVTAAVNPGMSGAPVVDRRGRLVGLVTLNNHRLRRLGAAIPLGVIRPVLEDLKAGRTPSPPGVAGKSTSRPAGYFGADVEDTAEGGVTVKAVDKESPAARIDVRVGDRIVEFNGQTIQSRDDFLDALAETEPGIRVRVTLERGQENIEKMAELGTLPQKGASR
jgi:S1-C subfamily serine protease